MDQVGKCKVGVSGGCRAAMVGVLALWLAGCATVDKPYVFSEQGLMPPAAVSAPLPMPAASAPDLPYAIALAREAQRQWSESARGEADRKRGVSAGLVGLSVIALIKGVSSPNAKDLAGLGAAGASLYAWGNTMTSSARNAIYREGIATLACAVEAVSPYDFQGWVGADVQTVNTLITTAQTAEATLVGETRRMRRLHVTKDIPVPGRSVAARCAPLKTAACTGATAGSTQAQLCEQLKADPDCTPRAATTAKEPPHPDLVKALDDAAAEQPKIEAALKDTRTLKGQAAGAGRWLWRTGVEIEQRVRDGIEKTEPDLTTVLSVSQALKSPPASKPATPAATTTPPTGDSQSGATTRSADRPAARPAGLDDLLDAIADSAKARRALEDRNADLRSALAAARSESCRRVLPLAFDPTANPTPTPTTTPPAVTPTPKGSTTTTPAALPATSNG